MITIHVARTRSDVRHRPTADADLAAPVALLGKPEFAERLKSLGYTMVDGSRRTDRPSSNRRQGARSENTTEGQGLRRLLLVADQTGTALPSPPYDNLDIGRAAEYLHGPLPDR